MILIDDSAGVWQTHVQLINREQRTLMNVTRSMIYAARAVTGADIGGIRSIRDARRGRDQFLFELWRTRQRFIERSFRQ
jgi:hypothetical protein